uniref:Phycobiliprotein ApcE n=1 Tax=Gastroclonium compressum TaxID=1852973 RepID=A0A173G026_GASCM|nr:phycobillisome linker protein [Coeloseira compressa]ANH09628.1 phycobillisome linker protein [Coeloseira compressa]
MGLKASSGSPLIKPKLYRTASMSTIAQAEQQDRYLQLGELNQLVAFLNSGNKRLEIASILGKNSNILVAKAADKIFVGGSAISYLEKPQASFLGAQDLQKENQILSGDANSSLFVGLSSIFTTSDSLPTGFKPISVVRYGTERMKKSLRDLDWFLRYLTYAIVAGDPNILTVNIRGLRELIDNACSSAAATVALREMRKIALTIFENDIDAMNLVEEYFNILITEFDSSAFTDKIRRRNLLSLQGLRLPQIYSKAGITTQKFVMKTSLSTDEKNMVIKACYRQVFERDIIKAYGFKFSDFESRVKNGILSIKEFIRLLAKSSIYRKQFFEPFVDSRVVELAFRHVLGRGVSSLEEFQQYFSIIALRGLDGLVDSLINSQEYADYFGEETVPYLRGLSEEAQESKNWGAQIDLLNYSTPFRKIPQFITLFSSYKSNLPDQHPYGLSNDPLAIQFGAIFPQNSIDLRKKSAPFGRDTRRILVRYGAGIYSQISNPSLRSLSVNSLGPKIFRLNNSSWSNESNLQNLNQVINAVYLRVFGRYIYNEEFLNIQKFENELRDSQISVRIFVKKLAKSYIFRSMYWEPFYICKAIEYIHNRLLGRPTYGRQEINKYFEIVYKEDYYAMIDAIIDSYEYLESFGNNIVPHERYITPLTLSARSLRVNKSNIRLKIQNSHINRLNESNRLLTFCQNNFSYTTSSIKKSIQQGVTTRRDQQIIFNVNNLINKADLVQVLRAIYRQVFERDLNSFSIGDEFYNLEKAFMIQEITVQQLIERLGYSSLYCKEFYQPYPNTKVIELGTKHFLGRAPNNQAEIRYYNQILASQGLAYFISTLVNSVEYNSVFGSNTVPYRRFPTLPAANFHNTEKLYTRLTKQNISIIIPSFGSVVGNQ